LNADIIISDSKIHSFFSIINSSSSFQQWLYLTVATPTDTKKREEDTHH